jgi:uncharacterized protein DUF397
MDETREVVWRRGSRCESGACIEVACVDDEFMIRDSKKPGGPILTFSRAEWQTFVAGVNGGDFDFAA